MPKWWSHETGAGETEGVLVGVNSIDVLSSSDTWMEFHVVSVVKMQIVEIIYYQS